MIKVRHSKFRHFRSEDDILKKHLDFNLDKDELLFLFPSTAHVFHDPGSAIKDRLPRTLHLPCASGRVCSVPNFPRFLIFTVPSVAIFVDKFINVILSFWMFK